MRSKRTGAGVGTRDNRERASERGRAERGRRGAWGKESEQPNVRQNTGDRQGEPNGTRGEGKERRGEERGERRAKREQNRKQNTKERGDNRTLGAAGELHGTTCDKAQTTWQKMSVT